MACAAGRVPVRHRHDDGVWRADVAALDDLPAGVTAVVSLCLVGRRQVPPGVEHVGFRLIDAPEPGANPHLDFLLADAAATIATLREEGRVVLRHCVAAESRTPTVAAYAVRRGVAPDAAVREVLAALPGARCAAGFRAALASLTSSDDTDQPG